MLECITTLIANLLYDASGGADPDTLDYAQLEIGINSEIDHIIDACKESGCPVYIVTNELGMSITPENRLARHFVDIAGRINQKLARQAEQVWLVVSGSEFRSNEPEIPVGDTPVYYPHSGAAALE